MNYRAFYIGGEGAIRGTAYDGVDFVAVGTWTRVPGPRKIYWSHGLVVPEEYRRRGISVEIHNCMWNLLDVGAVVLLSVSDENLTQQARMRKLEFTATYHHLDEYTIYRKVKT